MFTMARGEVGGAYSSRTLVSVCGKQLEDSDGRPYETDTSSPRKYQRVEGSESWAGQRVLINRFQKTADITGKFRGEGGLRSDIPKVENTETNLRTQAHRSWPAVSSF